MTVGGFRAASAGHVEDTALFPGAGEEGEGLCVWEVQGAPARGRAHCPKKHILLFL